MGSHEGEGPKQFKVGFRGYRREPVDEYVERLHQWLVDSEARAEHAVEAATTAVGDRAAEILRARLGRRRARPGRKPRRSRRPPSRTPRPRPTA